VGLGIALRRARRKVTVRRRSSRALVMAAGSQLAQLEAAGPALRYRRAEWDHDIEWLKEVEDRYENAGLINQQ
jgi:hypothetical protein